MVFHNLSDVVARDVYLCLLLDDFLDLFGCAYAVFFQLLDCIKSELELALQEHFLLPQVFNKGRLPFDLVDQLSNKLRSDSKIYSSLFVAHKLYANSLPDFLNNI